MIVIVGFEAMIGARVDGNDDNVVADHESGRSNLLEVFVGRPKNNADVVPGVAGMDLDTQKINSTVQTDPLGQRFASLWWRFYRHIEFCRDDKTGRFVISPY